jgi:hypothetical protein
MAPVWGNKQPDRGVQAQRVLDLVHLIDRSALHGMSEAAYQTGLEAAFRVNRTAASAARPSWCRCGFWNPVREGGVMTVPLRWEATSDGDHRSRLGLVGSYRPPLGHIGAASNKVITRRVAAATVRSCCNR